MKKGEFGVILFINGMYTLFVDDFLSKITFQWCKKLSKFKGEIWEDLFTNLFKAIRGSPRSGNKQQHHEMLACFSMFPKNSPETSYGI